MGNSIINWIEQWLTDMRQRVVVDGEVSSWKSVLSGVPEGSVLGPILFLGYINDLEEGVTGKILKFADDTKLFRKTKEIGDNFFLQNDIDKLVKWSEKWQMIFNFGNCKCLHPGPGNTSMNYEMGGTIYTIIRHKSVDVRKLQVAILARSPREMSQTDRIIPRYILSRVRVSFRPRIFLYAKKTQTRVARMLYISMDPLCGQINN